MDAQFQTPRPLHSPSFVIEKCKLADSWTLPLARRDQRTGIKFIVRILIMRPRRNGWNVGNVKVCNGLQTYRCFAHRSFGIFFGQR
jgi:hypothetical protein